MFLAYQNTKCTQPTPGQYPPLLKSNTQIFFWGKNLVCTWYVPMQIHTKYRYPVCVHLQFWSTSASVEEGKSCEFLKSNSSVWLLLDHWTVRGTNIQVSICGYKNWLQNPVLKGLVICGSIHFPIKQNYQQHFPHPNERFSHHFAVRDFQSK